MFRDSVQRLPHSCGRNVIQTNTCVFLQHETEFLVLNERFSFVQFSKFSVNNLVRLGGGDVYAV